MAIRVKSLLHHDLAASVDVEALAEAGWHGACPYTVELAAVEGVPIIIYHLSFII